MSLKKNVAYNTILTVSNVAFPIITIPYVSRILGVENVGIVNFAIMYASYFMLFAALGIPIYGIREIAKYNNDPKGRQQVFSELFLINCISTFIFLIIYLATVYFVPTLRQDYEFLLIAGLFVLFIPLNVDWFFAGREKFKLITVRTIASKLISIGGLFIFVRTKDDIIPYLALTIVANLSSQVWNFVYMLKKEVRISFKNLQIKRHLNSVFVLFVSKIAVSVYTLNTVMLGFLSDYTQVGYYTSAIKGNGVILPLVTSMSPVIIARINTLKGEDRKKQIAGLLNRSFGYMMMLAAPAAIGLIFTAPRFVPLFFGAEFVSATISVQLLSLLIVITGLGNLFGSQVLVAMGYEKKFLIAVLLGIASSFLLNMILIGPYGSLGASIASLIAEIIAVIVTLIFASKVISVHINRKNIYQPIVAALPIIPVSLIFNHIFEQNFSYIFATALSSVTIYVFAMIFILKNEQANQVLHSIVEKIKIYL
jgi:O-antigen/teichoic acid export membrane protein